MSQEYKGEMGDYKILKPIEYFDEERNPEGHIEVGAIINVPRELGDAWVENGDAEPAQTPEPGDSDIGTDGRVLEQ